MMSLEQLDLADLPMEQDQFAKDPLPYFAAARQRHPWLAKCSFGYVVHEYSATKELLSMDDCLRGSYDGIVQLMGAQDTPWGRFTESQMLAHSGDSHRRLRSVLVPKFNPMQANLHRELMRQVIGRLLDEWVPKSSFDFEEFASYFPITVMCRLIGAEPGAVPAIRKSLEALGLGFGMDPQHLPQLQQAIGVLDEFVQQLVGQRRSGTHPAGPPDLLDDLLEARGDEGLTERELYDVLIFLFVAGYDTSKNVLTMMMNLLLDRPQIYAQCAADPDYCHKVVDETLRYISPATIPRAMARDTDFRGVRLPAGTMMFFPVSVIGHDPVAFPDPDRFDPDRVRLNRHLAFGRGAHMCLGQFIARAQIEEGLHAIAQRIRNPKRAGPSAWRPFYGVWGMRGLPIQFN